MDITVIRFPSKVALSCSGRPFCSLVEAAQNMLQHAALVKFEGLLSCICTFSGFEHVLSPVRAAVLSREMERELCSRRKYPKTLLTAGETTISREEGSRVHNGVEIGEILIQSFSATVLNTSLDCVAYWFDYFRRHVCVFVPARIIFYMHAIEEISILSCGPGKLHAFCVG